MRLRLSLPIVALGLAASSVQTRAVPAIRVVEGAQGGYNCSMVDATPGVHSLDVVHMYNIGATAVRFKIESSPGMTMTYLSEDHPFAFTDGNTQDGITICYGSCAVGDQLVATIHYMAYGTSDPCTEILVVPHPDAHTIDMVDCEGTPQAVYAGDIYVQEYQGECGCPDLHAFEGTPRAFACNPLSIRSTTWSSIKALYR